MDSTFNEALMSVCENDSPAALVTITHVKGSTPRKPGAKMLILPNGQTFGTIGGGCGEAEVKQVALNVLDTKIPQNYFLNMTNEMAEEEGMVCGGIMEVYIDYLGGEKQDEKELLKGYLKAIEQGEEPVLVTIVKADLNDGGEGIASKHAAQKGILGKKMYWPKKGQEAGNLGSVELSQLAGEHIEQVRLEGKPKLISLNSYQLFLEPNPPVVELLVLGAGHIALPLAKMGKILGYQVTVVDDRPTFANVARFPEVDRVICDEFVRAIQQVKITSRTFVVIVTRGHRHDKVCLREVIEHPAFYIGMIGSKRRVKALLADLKEEGISPEGLDSIHSPIGLQIGAETPEEIAICILGEIINTYRNGKV